MFVSIAASIVENIGCDGIWYVGYYSDRKNLFLDCYQVWVIKANKLLKINASKAIKLEAPLLGFTKEQVLETLESMGISKRDLFSGYGELA